MSAPDIDPIIRHCIKLLHSSAPDSAEKIRIALDEAIKQKYGSSKMLINTLSKKQLANECLAVGSGVTERRQSHKSSSDSKGSKSPSQMPSTSSMGPSTSSMGPSTSTGMINTSEIISIDITDQDDDILIDDDDDNQLKELEDLVCIVCRRMDVSARNRLIECSDCHSLYHQECHKPQIPDTELNEQACIWSCEDCKNKSLIMVQPVVTTPTPTTTSVITTINPTTTTTTTSSSSSSSSSSGGGVSSASTSSNKYFESMSTTAPIAGTSSSSSSSSSSSASRSKSSSSTSSSTSKHGTSSSIKLSSSSQLIGCSSTSASISNTSNSSSKSNITPSINIISADKRLQIMKKKAAKLQETKRKHK